MISVLCTQAERICEKEGLIDCKIYLLSELLCVVHTCMYCTYVCIHTRIRTHACTHTRTHTRAHTHTHTHTHTRHGKCCHWRHCTVYTQSTSSHSTHHHHYCTHIFNILHTERMGNYLEAVKIILSIAKNRGVAAAEKVCSVWSITADHMYTV